MWTELYWVPLPDHPGRLALAPRPRGGDWLADELAEWRRQGVTHVVSLLEPDEAAELGLDNEAGLCREAGIEFASLPIADRGVPTESAAFARFALELADRITDGDSVVAHCRQGIGRAGMLAVGILKAFGWDNGYAIRAVSAARGQPVPETTEQRRWLDDLTGIPLHNRA